MLRGEANGSFAFTAEKAAAFGIERTTMIAGSSLEVIGAELAMASEEGWIPYAPTLGQYISAEDGPLMYRSPILPGASIGWPDSSRISIA